MEYVNIPPHRFNDVIVHLQNAFFLDEPLNKSVELCTPGCGHGLTEKYSLKTLNEGLSLMAVTPDQEIAGVVLNGCLQYKDVETSWKEIEALQDDAFKKIFVFLYKHNARHNLFREFNVDKVFEVRILSVDAKFRGQGIAKSLLRKCEEFAAENGFRLLKMDATSMFTQKVAASLGYLTRSEYRYDEYVDENNERIFDVEPPHQSNKIMYKLLDDEHMTAF